MCNDAGIIIQLLLLLHLKHKNLSSNLQNHVLFDMDKF